MSTLVYYDLIQDYAHVCNVAMIANKDRFPFKQIFDAAESGHAGEQVEVIVSDNSIREIYIFQINGHEIEVKPHTQCENCQCIRHWSVSPGYLQNVAGNPYQYIENPAVINWEWLYDTEH